MPDDLEILGCEPRIGSARWETLRRRSLGVGLVLTVAGIAWGAQVVARADIDRYWPAVIMLTGATLWAAGALVRDPGRQWMAIVGSAVLVTGAVLSYQVPHGRWESWWYAWPLVVPLSVGMAILVCSAVKWGPRDAWRVAVRLMTSGAFLSVFLFLVLEGVVGIGDLGIRGRWPLLSPLWVLLAGLAIAAWPRDEKRRGGLGGADPG